MHVRRLYYTCLLLTTLCPMLWIQQAAAMPLDPHSFASLGAFPTTPGTYQIDTGTLQCFDPSNKVLFVGVNVGGIAVFTFGGDTTSGINIIATGIHPLALLFQGDFIYSGTLDVSGNGVVPGPGAGRGGGGGSNANGGVGGMGGGSGGGIAGSGGSFGGFGGHSGAGNSIVRATYGDLAMLLEGGSGGGGGDGGECIRCPVGGPGGGGGGGIEIGALGHIVISGFIVAHGGSGADGGSFDVKASAGGGGGSGGASSCMARR